MSLASDIYRASWKFLSMFSFLCHLTDRESIGNCQIESDPSIEVLVPPIYVTVLFIRTYPKTPWYERNLLPSHVAPNFLQTIFCACLTPADITMPLTMVLLCVVNFYCMGIYFKFLHNFEIFPSIMSSNNMDS